MANAEPDAETMRQALEVARDTEGEIPPNISAILEAAVATLWRRIQTQPDTYLMSTGEYSLFTYFQERFQDEVARRARERYWDSK